jgi:hypothetical protein
MNDCTADGRGDREVVGEGLAREVALGAVRGPGVAEGGLEGRLA